MKPYKAQAHIHSLNGEMDEITIIDKVGDNDYIVDYAEGNKNHMIFAATVVDLMNSQGFYGRLYRSINEMDDDRYEQFFELIGEQNFKDSLDVVLWLEC